MFSFIAFIYIFKVIVLDSLHFDSCQLKGLMEKLGQQRQKKNCDNPTLLKFFIFILKT